MALPLCQSIVSILPFLYQVKKYYSTNSPILCKVIDLNQQNLSRKPATNKTGCKVLNKTIKCSIKQLYNTKHHALFFNKLRSAITPDNSF